MHVGGPLAARLPRATSRTKPPATMQEAQVPCQVLGLPGRLKSWRPTQATTTARAEKFWAPRCKDLGLLRPKRPVSVSTVGAWARWALFPHDLGPAQHGAVSSLIAIPPWSEDTDRSL